MLNIMQIEKSVRKLLTMAEVIGYIELPPQLQMEYRSVLTHCHGQWQTIALLFISCLLIMLVSVPLLILLELMKEAWQNKLCIILGKKLLNFINLILMTYGVSSLGLCWAIGVPGSEVSYGEY